MGGKAVITHVMDFMARHRGRAVDISAIEKATGLERRQIQSALANARAKGVQIEVIVRGSVYRYLSDGEVSIDSAEQIAAGQHTTPTVTAESSMKELLAERRQSTSEEPEEVIDDLFVRIGWTDENEPILKAATSGEVFKGVPL